jgi:hypothetical protein
VLRRIVDLASVFRAAGVDAVLVDLLGGAADRALRLLGVVDDQAKDDHLRGSDDEFGVSGMSVVTLTIAVWRSYWLLATFAPDASCGPAALSESTCCAASELTSPW